MISGQEGISDRVDGKPIVIYPWPGLVYWYFDLRLLIKFKLNRAASVATAMRHMSVIHDTSFSYILYEKVMKQPVPRLCLTSLLYNLDLRKDLII